MKQIIHFPNLRKIIFFQTNRITHHKECLKLLFYMPAFPIMKKRERSEQAQGKQHNGEGVGPIIYK